MKKELFVFLALFCPFLVFSQNGWTKSGSTTSTTDKVGIGTAAPKGELQVVGNLVLGLDRNNKKFIFHPRTNGNGDFLQITNDSPSGGWDWSQGITLYRGGNVTIGHSYYDHSSKLTVNGDIKIKDGTQGAGKVLTSDANGKATWQEPVLPALPTNPQDGAIAFYNSGSWQAIAPGIEGQVLTLSGGIPAWEDPAGSTGSAPLQIGDEYAGGIVFYLDENGGGLVCATSDQSSGANRENAGRICDELELNGFDDWYLPSMEEIGRISDELLQSLNFALQQPNSSPVFYWTSEDNIVFTLYDNYSDHGFDGSSPEDNQHVRAIRAF